MSRHEPPRPTDAELAILRVLWRRGPSTVRKVWDGLPENRAIGYTTVLKMLQIMTHKGLVKRDESRRAHVYRTGLSETDIQGKLLDHLVDQAFDSSAARLVLRALSSRPASSRELAEIRRLIDRLEQKGGDS